MKRFSMATTCLGLTMLAAVGCEAPELPESATNAPPAAATEPEPEPELVAGIPGPPLPEEEFPVTDVPRKIDPKDPVQGRRSRDVGGVAGNIGAALWAKHKGIFDSIDYANQLYWPQHDFKYPPTHEAFMKDVAELALNGVPIPELAPGREYIYVPEMGAIGLMIRLTPGSPGSVLPTAEPGKEHIYDPKAIGAAGVPVPGLQADGSFDADIAMAAAKAAVTDQPVSPAADPHEVSADEELSPDPRTRVQQLGDRANSRVEDHALAPGGLAPVGGLGEGEF
jgi:hypothetical protein